MKANLPQREPDILSLWEEKGIYRLAREAAKGKPRWILHDGPPYSNGPIHLGQALNKVLKDVLVKHKALQGFDTPYIPGWDTHGLPNEIQAIKKFNINRREINPLELRKKCAESALQYMEIQKGQFKRLGVEGDWENPYLTLHHSYESTIIRVFKEMVKKDLVYRGLKPVYWCATCETALAEAEIEYKEKVSPSIFVRFPVAESLEKAFPGYRGKADILIWTTTPWTLPGNLAIAVHPDYTYVLVKGNLPQGEAWILAENLAPGVLKKLGVTQYEIIAKTKGSQLDDLAARHPFLDRDSLIINVEYVSLDEETGGTGCVHTAPGHGQEDFEAGLKYNLPILVPVDNHGRLTEEAGPFKGLHYNDANGAIVDHLKASGHLVHAEEKTHSYPHCWRCRQSVIFRATEQWFVALDIGNLRKRALECIEEVQWIPSWGKGRIYNMVADRPDWCISRQRIWGTPIPAFYCKSCGKTIADADVIDFVEKIFAQEGADAWFAKKASDLMPPGFTCPGCGKADFTQEFDIFDVWFESGVSHEAVCALREELGWPADLYLEGSDQHRGWFQLSLLPAVAVRNAAPFRAVLTHGWVLDGKGHTMHKSLGNVIDPQDLIKQYGADIVRLFISSVDYTSDVRISHEALNQVAEVYKKIRNTARFMLSNLYDLDPAKDMIPADSLLPLDRWALQQFNYLVEKVTAAYDSYQFHVVFYHLHNFCVIQMSSIYLDVLKDRLYTSIADSRERRSAQTALVTILTGLSSLMFPILSFTSEEIWQALPADSSRPVSVRLSHAPKVASPYLDEEEEKEWEIFLGLRQEVNTILEGLRRNKTLNQSLEARAVLHLNDGLYGMVQGKEEMLKRLLLVSQLELRAPDEAVPEGACAADNYPGVSILIDRARGAKCPRCWNYDEDTVAQGDLAGLCPRCVKTVTAERS
jgi:isoleucyl-tRNA synthetase